MATRRRFLLLVGASGAGIFLAKTGLIELPRTMVLQLAGHCWFCGKDRREVFGIAGVIGREPRICDECIGLCFDILAEEIEELRKGVQAPEGMAADASPSHTHIEAPATDELERLLRSASADPDADPREIVATIQAYLKRPPRDVDLGVHDFHCTFCGRSRKEVRKLISGPHVFICDDCTVDAGGLLARSGWRFTANA